MVPILRRTKKMFANLIWKQNGGPIIFEITLFLHYFVSCSVEIAGNVNWIQINIASHVVNSNVRTLFFFFLFKPVNIGSIVVHFLYWKQTSKKWFLFENKMSWVTKQSTFWRIFNCTKWNFLRFLLYDSKNLSMMEQFFQMSNKSNHHQHL